jgi:hypothetical protein
LRDDFAALVHGDDRAYRDYVLAELRTVRKRIGLVHRLMVNEVDSIGVALRSGMIDADAAVAWLNEINALDYLLPPTEAEREAAQRASEFFEQESA